MTTSWTHTGWTGGQYSSKHAFIDAGMYEVDLDTGSSIQNASVTHTTYNDFYKGGEGQTSDTVLNGSGTPDDGSSGSVQLKIGVGDGADGSVTIGSININTTPVAADRVTINKADGEAFTVSAIGSNTVTVSGTSTDGTAASAIGTVISSTNSDLSNQKIIIQRVPNYVDVTVSGALTADSWNSSTGLGGIVVFKATGTVTVSSSITVNGLGYIGGTKISNGNPGTC